MWNRKSEKSKQRYRPLNFSRKKIIENDRKCWTKRQNVLEIRPYRFWELKSIGNIFNDLKKAGIPDSLTVSQSPKVFYFTKMGYFAQNFKMDFFVVLVYTFIRLKLILTLLSCLSHPCDIVDLIFRALLFYDSNAILIMFSILA